MPHLVCDDVIQCAIGLHGGKVGSIELHAAFCGDQRGGASARRAQMRRTRLAKNASRPIDGYPRCLNQYVIDHLTTDHDIREVADDDLRPSICRGLKGVLLSGRESPKKDHRDRKRRRGFGSLSRLRAGAGDVDFLAVVRRHRDG